MAFLDTLSDAEIRNKLFDLGCEVGPVTPTTRKVYIKKLQTILENGNSSSGKSKSKGQPPASPQNLEESIFKNRRNSPPKPKSIRNKSPGRPSEVHPLASSTFVDSPLSQPNILKSSILNDNTRPLHSPKREVTPPEKRVSSSTSLPPADDPSSFRSAYNLNNTPGYNGTSGSKFNSPTYMGGSGGFRPRLSDYDQDQPYASDFTRRLSNSSVSRIAAQTNTPRSPLLNSKIYDSVKESDDEEDGGGPIYTKFGVSSRGPLYPRDNGRAYPKPYGGWFGKDASVFILGFLALFFVIVAYAYIHMHHSDSSVSSYVSETAAVPNYMYLPSHHIELSYPRCYGLVEPCIPDHEVEKATTVFKLLCSELSEMAAGGGCSDRDPPTISSSEASRIINVRASSLSVFELDNHIFYAGILANSNPSWNVVHTFKYGFRLRELPSSFICSLVNHTMSLAFWLVRIMLFLVVLLSIYLGVKWWSMRRSKHREEVIKLFTQILELVSSTAVQDGPGFAVVSHIRDRLIPAQDKMSKIKLWEEALSLLESDSRIRTEVQQVEGEDFLVWRWLAPPPNPKRKVWQGQAFETMDGSVNSLPESPTSCLKIRHMFDPSQEEGDGWVTTVVDAILEKCKDAVIYHIVVEKQSPEGCVYVKCATPRDAGIAYRALHGFWFDTKLVTVKYIRETRYLERFPDSARAKYPLVPSSKHQN